MITEQELCNKLIYDIDESRYTGKSTNNTTVVNEINKMYYKNKELLDFAINYLKSKQINTSNNATWEDIIITILKNKKR